MQFNRENSWERYALMTELITRLQKVNQKIGKTILEKMLYLLQVLYKVDAGYDFEFYTYGPYSSQILNDLNQVESLKGLRVERVTDLLNGYKITTDIKSSFFTEKGRNFIGTNQVDQALTQLTNTFGQFSAKDLELIATIVYVDQEIKMEDRRPEQQEILEVVKELKPRFSEEVINSKIDFMKNKEFVL
jgi:uncharacterized protein YwgA